MGREDSEPTTEFGKRLWEAMRDEKKTPTRTEREAGLKRGYMSQIKVGKIVSPGTDVVSALVRYLNVSYEWLAAGRGPKRPHGWAPSALERAMIFAEDHGTRRDAIDAAIERHRNATEKMTGTDWVLAFDAEARRLDRDGVPRPEVVAAKQRAVRRLAKKDQDIDQRKAALVAEIAELEAKKAALDAVAAAELKVPKKGRTRKEV